MTYLHVDHSYYNTRGAGTGTIEQYTTLARPDDYDVKSSHELKLEQFFITVPTGIQEHSYAVLSRFPGNPIDYDKLITVRWAASDGSDRKITRSLSAFPSVLANAITATVTRSLGTLVESGQVEGSLTRLIAKSYAFIYLEDARNNWVKWSQIGKLDFTINESNVAGERPLNWKGSVYKVLKLGNNIAVYGADGISLLSPSERYFGLQNIHDIGLKSKNAAIGTDFLHLFIDDRGKLYKLTGEGLQLLDYSEYLKSMNDVVMSYDVLNELIYICDNNVGYIYNVRDNSFGTGPNNISGIGYHDGVAYSVSPSSTIEEPVFEIHTDIYDMGTRKEKTIHSIEMSSKTDELVSAAIDCRMTSNAAFASTAWIPVNDSGVVDIPCHGVDFIFKLRLEAFGDMELSRLKLSGYIHDLSYRDSLLLRGV